MQVWTTKKIRLLNTLPIILFKVVKILAILQLYKTHKGDLLIGVSVQMILDFNGHVLLLPKRV